MATFYCNLSCCNVALQVETCHHAYVPPCCNILGEVDESLSAKYCLNLQHGWYHEQCCFWKRSSWKDIFFLWRKNNMMTYCPVVRVTTDLQWTTTGPGSITRAAFNLWWNIRNAAVSRGTQWSGHELKWYWVISRLSMWSGSVDFSA